MNYKDLISAIFRRLGYGVYRIGNSGVYRIGSKEEYTIVPPYDNYVTYSPWFTDWFQQIYNQFRDHTLLEEHRCYMIYQLCRYSSHLDGDFAECGVYKGGSAFLICDTLIKSAVQNKEVHLFDTFTGMPEMTKRDPASTAVWEGRFGDTSLIAVKEYLHQFLFVLFHPGLIPETFEVVRNRKFAFVHIDIDLYQSHLDCCNFFYDRMVKGGVLIFDDYGRSFFRTSARQAVDEFFENRPESVIVLHTGQGIVFKA